MIRQWALKRLYGVLCAFLKGFLLGLKDAKNDCFYLVACSVMRNLPEMLSIMTSIFEVKEG